VSLLVETAKEVYHYVWPAVLVPSFYVWWFIQWAVVAPFVCAGSCIAETASTVYNFKLPAIAVPDMSDLWLVPAAPGEFLQNLPNLSLSSLPSITIPPFSELPVVKQIMRALSNVDLWPQIVESIYNRWCGSGNRDGRGA
jgi:hypothetical protein